jgi:PAS domain-containing protein
MAPLQFPPRRLATAPKSPVASAERVFATLPHGYLILNRSFIIVDVNSAYAKMTLTDPDQLIGREIFDVFPDNPGDPEANGVENLTDSLESVLAFKATDKMAWQRYDIRDRSGVFVERHWDPNQLPNSRRQWRGGIYSAYSQRRHGRRKEV